MSNSNLLSLDYNDPRYGDVYRILVTKDYEFVSADRYLDGDISSPIHYDAFWELNPYHQNQIETLLCKLQKRKK